MVTLCLDPHAVSELQIWTEPSSARSRKLVPGVCNLTASTCPLAPKDTARHVHHIFAVSETVAEWCDFDSDGRNSLSGTKC